LQNFHNFAGPKCILSVVLSNSVGSENAYSFIYAVRLIVVHANRASDQSLDDRNYWMV